MSGPGGCVCQRPFIAVVSGLQAKCVCAEKDRSIPLGFQPGGHRCGQQRTQLTCPMGRRQLLPKHSCLLLNWTQLCQIMETQKTRHGKNELFMFKHGNPTSTLSLLGWHPCVISQPVWLWGLAYGFPRLCCGPSVRERWMINGICSRCPLSLGMVHVETLCLLFTSLLAAPGSCRHCLEEKKGVQSSC